MGYLVGRPGPARLRVDEKSLNRFGKDFVALAAIARELNSSSARLLRLCVGAGIETLMIPRHGGSTSPVPFIRRQNRDALERISEKNPSRNQRRNAVSAERPVAKLQRFLDKLVKSGSTLPRRGGRPNKAAIARACGFDRNALYHNEELVALLNTFDNEDRQRHGG